MTGRTEVKKVKKT